MDGEFDSRFSQVEFRILRVTADGRCHSAEEIMTCFDDPAVDKVKLGKALTSLRRKLAAVDQDIIAQSFGRRIKYRRIRELCQSVALGHSFKLP